MSNLNHSIETFKGIEIQVKLIRKLDAPLLLGPTMALYLQRQAPATSQMVPQAGLEPALPRGKQILSPAHLR
jgi:hypothetical protein